MKPTTWIGIVLLWGLGGCASAGPAPNPLTMLDEAEELLGVGQPADARALLEAVDRDIYPLPQKARYGLLLARATYHTGEPWAAFQLLRRFPDDFPHSENRLEVEQLVFDIGQEMSRTDAWRRDPGNRLAGFEYAEGPGETGARGDQDEDVEVQEEL